VIWELRHKHKISLLIEISGLARSTYYYYVKPEDGTDKHSEVKNRLRTSITKIADVTVIVEL